MLASQSAFSAFADGTLAADDLAHIAAYKADGYEIIYVEDTDGATLKDLVKNNTAADKKVVFALTSDIALTGDLNLNHNGGTIVITSAGGNINIGTKSILLYSDKDANFIFDKIAIDKGTGKRGINGLGNNITFTETFTTTSVDTNVLYLNALADSASAESNGSTIIVETPSKIAIRASGFSGNKTNGDVNYVFGKNANASLIVAGRAGADDAQLELNGNSTVIVRDNATISKISITDQKSYLTGNLDIEIRDNATVKTIDINAEVGGNASIDIKGGTVNTVTFKSGVVKGKAVIKANTDKAAVGEITDADYVVNYNGDLGSVAYSADFKSITLTPEASVRYVTVTNGDTVDEYNANGDEVTLAGEFSVDLASGTTTVEFLTEGTELYTITFADGETTETQTVAAGTVPTAPAWTKDGYTLGWDKEIVAATESTTYTAVWEANAPTTAEAVFDANGGAWGEETTKTVETTIGEVPTAPTAPVREGYVFLKWTPELSAITADGATYTAFWEPDHIAAYRAQGYEIIYADTNNKTTFKGMVNENTAPGKKVVFALMHDIGNANSFDIEPMGGTVVFTSAGGAFRFNAPMKFVADHDTDIIFDHMTVTEVVAEEEIIAYGNNITFTDTFKNTTGNTLIVYANCNSTTESNGNTVTIETDAKMWVFASGASGNLTNGDVTYIFGKNATGTLYAAGKVTKTDGRQTYVNGDVKVTVKDNATLSKISVAQNQSYLKGNLDIEIRDNANVKAINLDKKVEGNAYIDIKGGTVGPITETAGKVTGKIVIKADTDKATVGEITGADYVVNYNGDLGSVAYSADFKSITLTPNASVKYVRVTNGDTVDEYNANGNEVTLAGEFTVALASGTTTVEFLEEGTETKKVTFVSDGETVSEAMVAVGTLPVVPTLTKEGYTLSWDKEIVAVTEAVTYTAVWTENGPAEVTSAIKVIFAREDGTAPVNPAKLYIYEDDTKSELVNTITLENSETSTAEVTVDVTLTEGTYYAEVVKNGYLTFKTAVTVTATAVSISEIKLIAGDIKGSFEDECGDGIVDIDDLVRVLRGFADNVSEDIKKAVDINEDGSVNVADISAIKSNFGKKAE